MKSRKITYSFVAMLFELFEIFAALSLFVYLFSMLDISKIDQVYDTVRYYDVFTYKHVPEAALNAVMALCIFVLLIAVPLIVLNYRNFRNLEKGSYERENGIFQLIAGFVYIIVLNIPACILYILSASEILEEKPKVKKPQKFDWQETDSRVKYLAGVILSFLLLSVLAVIIIVPFYWMIVTSLKSKATFSDFANIRFFIALKDMYWINFKEALTKANFAMYIENTLYVALITTAGTLITTVLAAFAFSRLEFKGRDFIFSVLLMTMMVPGELYVITNFVTISRTFPWYNTFYALIVPFITDVFYIFFLRQTFKQIPDSLYKAAKVDGCSDFKFLTRVMVPIAIPTLITITILNALGTWNAYVWPRLVTESDHYLVSIALRNNFINSETGQSDYRLQMAASTLITVPILIVFLFARKYIMRGVGRSGTKG